MSLTRFIGRNDEIDTVVALLHRDDIRLCTLTGPGGIGKTRLSMEIASRFQSDPHWTVHFVTLASLNRVEDALPAVAMALGIWDAQQGDLVQRLAQTLANSQTLLVLDNVEHVISVAVDIGKLLQACPVLTILATSRVPLHIQGEREYSVPQLTVPDPEALASPAELLAHESLILFIDRAQAVDRDFTLNSDNAQTLAHICSRLDGLPLAIELAAARVKALPPDALLGRLGNQLNTLRSNARDVPPRLQTMRATIDWSYLLLDAQEQQAMRILAVLAGDFSLPAAAALLQTSEDDAIDIITSLVDKSLLLPRGYDGEQPYYRMLAVVREFGLEQLAEHGDSEQARLRHAEYIAELSTASYAGQFSARQAQVFESLDRVHENVRQALGWAIDTGRWLLAARIAAHMWQYWVVRGNFAEGRQWFERLLAGDRDYPLDLLPDLYFGFSYLAGNPEETRRNAAMAQRLIAIGEATGHRRVLATGTLLAGLRPWDTDGLQACLQAVELWTELGDPIWAGRAAGEVSRLARERGDLDLAETYAWKFHDMVRDTGHLWGIAQATAVVGRMLHSRGKTDEALARLQTALTTISSTGDFILVLRIVESFIDIAGSQGQHERAVRLAAAAAHLRATIGYDIRYSADMDIVGARMEQARLVLREDSWERAWAAGSQLGLEQAITEALAIEAAPADRATPQPGPGGLLTRREREVLQRITTGQTDQEIADALFVSYRTVTTHVTNILNKLDASTRTEAAAIAVREDLV